MRENGGKGVERDEGAVVLLAELMNKYEGQGLTGERGAIDDVLGRKGVEGVGKGQGYQAPEARGGKSRREMEEGRKGSGGELRPDTVFATFWGDRRGNEASGDGSTTRVDPEGREMEIGRVPELRKSEHGPTGDVGDGSPRGWTEGV